MMPPGSPVQCPACGHLSREGARFCANCAEPLRQEVPCPSCGASNLPGQNFCDRCGTRLEERRPIPAPDPRSYTPDHLAEKIRTAKANLEGERKQVTVLFADVKGSMELGEGMDPEAWRRIIERMFALMCEGVYRFEGTVNQFTGDGMVALFGAPIAHEDHAQRACHAALYLSDQLARYAEQLKREEGLDFSVRMGLNSGEVVVGAIGEDLQMDYTAIGHSVGLGQRMEQLAEPGRAYLTEYTAALISGYFELRDKGLLEIKGVRMPLRVYELAGAGAARTRLDISGARGFTRFVGRESELASLETALDRVVGGKGQVLGIVAEPGLGKSRLCYELARRCRERGITVYEGHGVAHGKRVPWLVVLELLRGYFGIGEQDAEQTAREQVAGKVLQLDEALSDVLPLLFDFLGVADPKRPAPRMDPEARQRQIFATVRRLIHARSRREPALILLEDLQWLDGSSEAFLENMVEALPGTRTLLLVNFRPEYHAGWMQKSYYQQLPLSPLGEEAIEELLQDLLGPDPSLDGLSQLITGRTGGNPFFIEEVVKGLVDKGSLTGDKGAYRLARSVDEVTIPPTVQAVLAARIDRLPEEEKAVLQGAAVIGRQFPEAVLRHAMGLSGTALEDALRALTAAEFIYEESPYPEPEYAFMHPLTQEVAHRSQLAEQRARMHRRVAEAIAELYPHKLDEQAALLAHHSEAAGDMLAAAKWSARAAGWAGLSDPAAAAGHWRKVRTLVETGLPESAETMTLGLAARIWTLRLAWRLGCTEEEAAAIFAEGKALAERAEDLRSLAMLTVAYAAIRGLTGHVEDWAELGSEALRLAERTGDRGLQLAVRPPPTYALFVLGRLREALATIERGLELAAGDARLGADTLFVSPYAWSIMTRSFLLAYLGRLKDAVNGLDTAMQLARDEGDVEVLGYAHANRAWLARETGELESALAHAAQAVDIAERMGNAYARTQAYSCLALAHASREEWNQAVEAGEQSLAISRERRTGVQFEPWTLATLAEAYLARGDGPRARATAEQAVAIARGSHIKIFEPIALRSLARVLRASEGAGARAEVKAALSRALALAREMEARSEEPLVHVELAELARLTGDESGRERELQEARRIFAEIGADRYAAALTRELSAAPTGRSSRPLA
jgi:class 3 adenylate cyclase/tetratricopeptide (TPR) repeat protein